MPTYEYRCPKCSTVHERACRIEYRNEAFHCARCRTVRCERILTVPHSARWNEKEIFPNLHKIQDLEGVPGGMRFESREAYDTYLEEHQIRELGGPKCMKGKTGGHRSILRYGKKETQPLPPRGSW